MNRHSSSPSRAWLLGGAALLLCVSTCVVHAQDLTGYWNLRIYQTGTANDAVVRNIG
jgi:hypothetical protein